jgi:hypothetical protein
MTDGFVTKIAANGASLLWSSYLGGNGSDVVYGVVLDGSDNVYLVGETGSKDFPTAGGFDTVFGQPGPSFNGEAFVTKVNASGASIAWSSYYGGHNGPGNDRGKTIAVDEDGNVYVTGYALSTDFPVSGAFSPLNKGGSDVFVSKLAPTGSNLIWSTYVGGSGEEAGLAIAVNASQAVYVTGWTTSSDFPQVRAFSSPAANFQDAFVFKLKPSGATLAWSSRLGGSQQDVGQAIALDGLGHVIVAGWTESDDLPRKDQGFNSSFGGTRDGFVALIQDFWPSLTWTAYMGGLSSEAINGLAVDVFGDIVVSGQTFSSDFPVVNAFQPTAGGGCDGFVAKIGVSPPSVIWSSYLGGSAEDVAYGVGVDPLGDVYVTGATLSTNFPVPGGFDPSHNGFHDAFVVKINASGPGISWGTYLGGSDSDFGAGISVSDSGAVIVSGNTYSIDFPTVAAFSPSNSGSNDAFIAVYSNDGSALLSSSYLGGGGHDEAYGVVVQNGAAYATGFTSSENFPIIGGFDSTFGFAEDAFVVKIDGLPDGGVTFAPVAGPPRKGKSNDAACGLIGLDALLLAGLCCRFMRRWEKV